MDKSDEIWERDGMYSYHNYVFKNEINVDIYLLDVRYFQDKRKNILLGEKQWKWLNNSIAKRSGKADVTLFVSGIQILPYYRGILFPTSVENWSSKSNQDRLKLMEIILKYNISNPILISGDVHYAEIAKMNCIRNDNMKYIQSLYEITSSGLTHSWDVSYPGILTLFKNMTEMFRIFYIQLNNIL